MFKRTISNMKKLFECTCIDLSGRYIFSNPNLKEKLKKGQIFMNFSKKKIYT